MSTGTNVVSAYSRACEFIRKEFFSLDYATFAKVMRLYEREYGTGAYNYLMRTYHSWRLGTVGMSGQTQYRILHCVPRVLSSAKQFTILSFYIPEFMRQVVDTSRAHKLTIDAIPTAFANAAKRCQEIQPKLDWFVCGIFTEEEVAAFVDVARYTAIDRLQQCYAGVCLDLATMADHLSDVDASVNMRYRVDELGVDIELVGLAPSLPTRAFDSPSVPNLVVKHPEEYERLLLNHDCDMLVEQDAQVVRHAVVKLDLSILQNAIESISTSESIESSFRVRGAAGAFEGAVCKKNLPGLKAQFWSRVALASLVTLGLVAGIGAAVMFESTLSKGVRDSVSLVMMGSFLGIPVMWSWVAEKYKEVRDYERGKSTRFTKARRSATSSSGLREASGRRPTRDAA